ncbi:aminodeoxychorismate lyase [Leifsonia poae]|uniref:aminodeoxychorismate lyase n=1 Tax=Leifsonia poae TaxID=110933 RepID=UPI001CBEB9E8|nr:aminodeoxychorismate lyase [Leifsonia poae]
MTRATLLTITAPAVGAADAAPSGSLGFAAADPDAPQVLLTDLGLTRGDGVFETISVVDAHPQALEPHLLRLAHSAALLDLAEPDLAVWRLAVLSGIEAFHLEHGHNRELYAKLILTRGAEGTGQPSGWVYVADAEDFGPARRGIRVVTLDRGYRHDVAETSPWLLAGAKTLSYATNRAALREAARRGADDVVFVSSDGFALEGPTSNVIVLDGHTVRTPQTDQGILAGTTQASVFEFFEQQGFRTSYERIPADALTRADALWLVSSVRQAAPVTHLDGQEFPVDAPLSDALNEFLLSRTS